MTTIRRIALVPSVTIALTALVATAAAQSYGPGSGLMGPGMMMGPEMMGPEMMGPEMMGRGGFGRMCSPAAAGFAEWRLDRLERLIKPTDSQRIKFDEYKAASSKAVEIMRSACPTEVPATMPGRMEAMEKRMGRHAAVGKGRAADFGCILCHADRRSKEATGFKFRSAPVLALA